MRHAFHPDVAFGMSHAPTQIGRSADRPPASQPASAHFFRHARATRARLARSWAGGTAEHPLSRGVVPLALAALVAAGASGCGSHPASPLPDAGPPARCVAPDGAPTAPQTIADVVTLINALPSPVTIPCFLQALARPLKMHATVSLISAQPSAGARSPRIFLFSDGMRISIVPAGAGSPLLEMGEIRDEERSLKGEILFPVTTPLSPQAPFERILFTANITRCGFCHPVEQPDPTITFASAFTSVALRPLETYAVSVDSLSNELATCDPTAEPDRCAMLQALFDQGVPIEQPFPPDLPTIQ